MYLLGSRFALEIGSSLGVKSHHFRVKIQIVARMGDFLDFYSEMVRMKGLEPSRREAHAPKACVSTNSTTSAYSIVKDTPAYLLMTYVTHAVTTSMQLTAKVMSHFY